MRKWIALLGLLIGAWFLAGHAVHAAPQAGLPTSAPAFQSVVSSANCTVAVGVTTFCFTSDKGFLQSVNGGAFVPPSGTGTVTINNKTGTSFTITATSTAPTITANSTSPTVSVSVN